MKFIMFKLSFRCSLKIYLYNFRKKLILSDNKSPLFLLSKLYFCLILMRICKTFFQLKIKKINQKNSVNLQIR